MASFHTMTGREKEEGRGERLSSDGKYQETQEALHRLHSLPALVFPFNFRGLPCAFLLTPLTFFL
jgi:hypothetical protein